MGSSKRRRSQPSGYRLTDATAAVAKGMILRGDAIQSVAAYFGVNSARISDLMDGVTFPGVTATPPENLPPPGPYLPVCTAADVVAALSAARLAIDRCGRIVAGFPAETPGSQ